MEPDDQMKALSADEALHDELHGALCALALGELHGDEARALEARLASEPALAAQYDAVRATIALVRTSLVGAPAQAEVLPDAHMQRVLGGARAHTASLTPIHDLAWYRRPAVRLAASLVLCAGAGFVGLRLMQAPADEVGSHDSTELGRREEPVDALGDVGGEHVDPASSEHAPSGHTDGLSSLASSAERSKVKLELRDGAGTPESLRMEVPQLEPGASAAIDAVEGVTNQLEDVAALGLQPGAGGADASLGALQPSAGYFFEAGAPGQAGGGSGGTGSFLTAESAPRVELAIGGAFEGAGLYGAGAAPSGSPIGSDVFEIGRAELPVQRPLDPKPLAPTGGGEELARRQWSGLERRLGDVHYVDPNVETTANGGFNPSAPPASLPGTPPISPLSDASTIQPVAEQAKLPATDLELAYKRAAAGEPISQPTPEPLAVGRAVDLPELETARDDLTQRLRAFRDDDQGGNPRLSDEQLALIVEQEWRRLHAECQRFPNERPRDMYFRFWGDNAFVRTGEDNQSTFGADVDTASYAIARRYLREGRAPERAQIRTEEFVNAFTPDLAPPTEETFGLHVELAPTPFGEDTNHWLVRVGVRGKEVAKSERQPLNLTFVVDTSGSMREQNRLELVKHAMRLLVSQLDARDTIAIVAYANDARQILAPTSAAHRDLIESAIHPLSPNGSTNAEAGLRMGYALAETTLAPGAHSRVVFLSDGVANMGQTDQDRINDDVKRFRDAGIYLNTIGVGMNNHNDAFLEQLANKGDGICDYVDDGAAAEKAIVERFTGAFVPIASDVKLQVEFDPTQVLRWRQLGYENRAIADQDFRNDKIDAGEVGAGHQVTCLYEVELADGLAKQDPAKALATLRVRWKAPKVARQDPNEIDVFEREATLSYGAAAGSFRAASLGFRRSALAAQLAEFLRRSSHARMDDYAQLAGEALALIEGSPRAAAPVVGASTGSFTEELVELADLVRRADGLGFGQRPPVTDLERTLDEYRRYQYLRATLQDLRAEGDPLLRQIEDTNRTLEQQIRDVLRRDLQRRNG